MGRKGTGRLAKGATRDTRLLGCSSVEGAAATGIVDIDPQPAEQCNCMVSDHADSDNPL